MNDTTFQGDCKVAYVPVVVNAKPKPITNADAVRAMSDEELAVLLEGCICPKYPCPDIDRDTPTDKKRCTKCWLDWLMQEAEP